MANTLIGAVKTGKIENLATVPIPRDDWSEEKRETQLEYINAKDEYGNTALKEACMRGYVDIAEKLLRCGAKLSIKDGWGRTLFHNACISGNLDIAKLLLSNGANINEADLYGKTPLDSAKEKHRDDVEDFLIANGGKSGMMSGGKRCRKTRRVRKSRRSNKRRRTIR
jgi:ankyrin repeat protein